MREELLDAHMAAQHVLLVGNLVEEAGRAVGERFEREEDGEEHGGCRAQEAEDDMFPPQPPEACWQMEMHGTPSCELPSILRCGKISRLFFKNFLCYTLSL